MKRIFALVVSAFMVFALSTGTAEARKGWDRRANVDNSQVKKVDNQRKGWDRKAPKRKGWDRQVRPGKKLLQGFNVVKHDIRGWDRKGWDRKGWDRHARKGWD